MTAVQDQTDSAQQQSDEALQRFAAGFSSPPRSPVLHWPSEHDLEYEDITFPALDGVPIEAWFIPAPGSDKLIIANHPLGFTRSGIPTHLEPWHAAWAPSGNGFEVDLVPDYKILHDAGYNVLAYDLRNHGLSSAANGGVVTHGFTESRDVVGSLEYARTRPDTRDMIIGLFSRCMGCVSTFAAMTRFPAAFDGVRCLVSPQPITPRYIALRRLAVIGLGDRLDDFNTLLRLRTSIGLERRPPGVGEERPLADLPLPGPRRQPHRSQRRPDHVRQHPRGRQEASMDRGHDGPMGWLPRVSAPPTAHARMVRPIHGVNHSSHREATPDTS